MITRRQLLALAAVAGGARREVRWREPAYAAFALAMENSVTDLEEFDQRLNTSPLLCRISTAGIEMSWLTPQGTLGLVVSARPGPAAEIDRTFRETLNGSPVPVVRLSSEKLV